MTPPDPIPHVIPLHQPQRLEGGDGHVDGKLEDRDGGEKCEYLIIHARDPSPGYQWLVMPTTPRTLKTRQIETFLKEY